MKLRDIFRAHKDRYVKLDGTSWHSGGLRAHFQSAALRGTALSVTAMGAAHAASGALHGADAIFAGMNILFIGLCGLHARNMDSSITPPHAFWNRFSQYAIDTEGRAFPPENEAELLREVARVEKNAMHSLRKVLPVTCGMSLVFGAIAGAAPVAVFPLLAMMPVYVRDALLIRRCRKLLHPDHIHRFAANPPRAPSPKAVAAPVSAKPWFS